MAHLSLYRSAHQPFELREQLRKLRVEQTRDWAVSLKDGRQFWPLRLCAAKKSEQAAERSRRKAQRRAQQDGVNIRPETLELAAYVFVVTNLEAEAW